MVTSEACCLATTTPVTRCLIAVSVSMLGDELWKTGQLSQTCDMNF